MKNFFQKRREIIAICAYFGVVFVVVYFAIMPLMKKIEEKNNEIQEEKINQEIVRKRMEELPGIQKQYEILKSSDDLSGILLDKNNAIVLIEKLEKVAEQTGNTISIEVQDAVAVDPKKTASKGKVTSDNILVSELPSSDYLQLKIKLNGKYEAILNFIQSLENFEYYGDIIEIQITKDADKVKAQPMQQAADFGVANPFISNTDTTKIVKIENDKLNASLSVVFYSH